MIINIKTLSETFEYEYEKGKNERFSFHKMVDTLSKMFDTTSVQCVLTDTKRQQIIFKDDIFYMEKWETFLTENQNNENNEIFLFIRPMFEIQTVKNHHLYTFLYKEMSEESEESEEWINCVKDTIVWFDVVGNRVYSVRYTGNSEIADMFSIQIDKFIDELKGIECDHFYRDKVTSIAKKRFQYIIEGRVI